MFNKLKTQYLPEDFFANPPLSVAKSLIGKVIFVRYQSIWLCAQIIETEAYHLEDKASHASLGFTEKRKALFMPAGTIYMYYARGGDSLNISCHGDGNAVLIKSAIPYLKVAAAEKMITQMQALNPVNGRARERMRLCSGQTLLCKSLNLKVPEWNQKCFDPERFFMRDEGYQPSELIQTTRLGIPMGRDEHLPYRFIDKQYAAYCTNNPLKKKTSRTLYSILQMT